jgi:uncharacterized repeat protein (TIGR04076 family)
MSEMYEVEVSVVSQKGVCGAGHKVGDKWTIGNTTPGGICLSVYPIIEGSIEVLKYGGAYPWSQDPDVCISVCPDPANPVVFELKRIKK